MKKVLSKIVLIVLLAALAVSAFACTKEEEDPGKLANQVHNWRYYYQQGYTDEWEAVFDENQFMIDEPNGLLFKAHPKAAEGKVEYRIYCKDTKLMLTTLELVMNKIMDEGSSYYFNKNTVYEDGVVRKDFVQLNEKYETKRYNKMQFCQVFYTFVDDNGESWKGVYNMIMKGTSYYLITYEALESEYDTYYGQYEEMIDDWRKLGWEENDK